MNWLATSIRNKILVVFVIGIALVAAGGIYGFTASRASLASVARVNDTLVAQALEAQALEVMLKDQIQQWMAVLLRGADGGDLERAWNQFLFREREVRRGAQKLREAVEVAEARDMLEKFVAAHERMGEKYREALKLSEPSRFDARKVDAAVKDVDAEPTVQVEDLVKVLREEASVALGGARDGASQGLRRSLLVIGATSAAALVAFIFCALLLMRTVVRPVAHAVKVVEAVAGGDLTVRVEMSSRDEMGRLLAGLDRMRESLAGAVLAIRRSAERVGTAAREMASGHVDLSQRTEQQASGLEETASAMEELAATVKENAESARQADKLAAGASETAAKGGAVMHEVAGTMSAMTQASRRIADIVGLIDGIAFQTNILALNAAVEAARAGEQGRGFAVVAAEVRALAQRSAAAAKEIKGLVEESVGTIDAGSRLVGQASETMNEIVASARRVTEVMSSIKVATQEQLSGIEQVSSAVSHMDESVQHNAAVMEQAAASAQSMDDEAEDLLHSVARFQLEAAPPPEAAPEPAPLEQEPLRPRPALRRLKNDKEPSISLASSAWPALMAALIALSASEAFAADPATIAKQQCAVCHGENGASNEPTIPTIGGMSAKYLSDTLKNYRKKVRACPEVAIPSGPKKGTKTDMCKEVANLADADFQGLGKHYAAMKFVRARQAFDAAKAKQGQKVYTLRCEKCHEKNGVSPDEDNGILAGQWLPYLREQMAFFRGGKRPIDEKMKLRLERVNKEEEEAVLQFFASQQ